MEKFEMLFLLFTRSVLFNAGRRYYSRGIKTSLGTGRDAR